MNIKNHFNDVAKTAEKETAKITEASRKLALAWFSNQNIATEFAAFSKAVGRLEALQYALGSGAYRFQVHDVLNDPDKIVPDFDVVTAGMLIEEINNRLKDPRTDLARRLLAQDKHMEEIADADIKALRKRG